MKTRFSDLLELKACMGVSSSSIFGWMVWFDDLCAEYLGDRLKFVFRSDTIFCG